LGERGGRERERREGERRNEDYSSTNIPSLSHKIEIYSFNIISTILYILL
jgi:hypothetical protein